MRSSLYVISTAVLGTLLWCQTASAQASRQNSLGMRLVSIPAGQFTMGLAERDRVSASHPNSVNQREIHGYLESPAFPVRLSEGFEISATEVTVGQFRQFVEATGYVTDAQRAGEAMVFTPQYEGLERFSLQPRHHWLNPGFEQTEDHPVTCVSFNDAEAFCRWLSDREGATYRLPTEAQWEYACRAGTTTHYSHGDDPDGLYRHANVADAALYAVHPEDVLRQRTVALEPERGDGFVFTAPVASFAANPWRLFDMHGNVWEWCRDKYSPNVYKQMAEEARERGSRQDPEPIVDYAGPDDTPQHRHGDWRSLRGGSWYVSPIQSRSSVRAFAEAQDAYSYIGFRVVRQ